MAYQYATVPIRNFGAGIDQQSAENAIPEGYSENLINADPKPQGYISKRKGYEGFSGYLPFRVKSYEYTDSNTLCLTLDDSVDLISAVRSTPVIVQGRSSVTNNGDFPSTTVDSVHYYSVFDTDVRKLFIVGTSTVTLTEDEHGVSTNHLFVGTTLSDSVSNNNNSPFIPDTLEITQANNSVAVTVTNATPSTLSTFIYVKDKGDISGTVYSQTSAIGTGTTVVSISSATHQLSNSNIIYRVYEDTGTVYREITPDFFTVDTSGNVAVTFNNVTTGFNALIILSATPIANTVTGSVPAMTTQSILISNAETDFVFIGCYLEQTIGGTREAVIPDTIVVDSVAETVTVSFTNNNLTAANFFLYYEFATIVTNVLCLDSIATGVTPFTDSAPQLTLWGIPHAEAYASFDERQGWVNEIDSYRAAGEQRLIAGLGGNLFESRERDEGAIATGFLLPQLYPNLRERVSTSVVIGPAFWDSADAPARTRGYIKFDGGGENFARITAIAYNSGTQRVDYTLSVPNLLISGTLSTIITATAGIEDYFTVEQAGYTIHNGSYRVTGITNPSTDVLIISVENESVDSSDYDETDSGALGAVFTDRVTLSANSPFLDDDIILSDSFGTDSIITVRSSLGTAVVLNNITEELSLGGGLRLVARRTSNILPLRTLAGVPSVENVVRGDLLSTQALTRKLRVVYINPMSDVSLSIDGDGNTATATLGSGTTDGFVIGQTVLLLRAGVYTGPQTITGIPNSTELQFESEETATGVTGTLLGKSVQLDEVLSIEDSINSTIMYTVDSRWIPIEAPEDVFNLTKGTYYRHFSAASYENQPIIRSTMVADSLYATNGADAPMKYDGTDLYRAGIPRWQPSLFISKTVGTGISIKEVTGTVSSVTPINRFTVALGEEQGFSVGEKIRHSNNGNDYIVTGTGTDSTSAPTVGYVFVDRNITGAAAGTISKVYTFKYYFRLNAVDANQNVIISAVTGADDNVVELTTDSAVRLRSVGFPAWDNYDFSRLELQIYRTQADTPAPFYRLTTIPLSFNNADGYVDYIDTDADDILKDLDSTATALTGAELPTTIRPPLIANYVTSAGNRLVLANLTDSPKLDVRLIDVGSRITAAVLNSKSFLFRRDNTDAGTSTDNTNRVRYVFRNTGDAAIAGITTVAGVSFTVDLGTAAPAAGSWIYLFRAAITDALKLDFAGWWMVNSSVGNTVTVLYSAAPAAVTGINVDRWLTSTTPTDVPVWLGTDGNYNTLNGNTSVTDAYEFVALRRMANAINVSMRKVDVSVTGYASFTPWMIAEAGNEYDFGQLVITQPRVETTVLEIELPAFTALEFNVFINAVKRASAASASALTSVFPSRLIASYANYPEIFDNPTAVVDVESDSAIDVNTADGQEITAVIPFFGDSAFGAAQKGSVVVVFKTDSIYLVNLAAKDAGQEAVQKIESQGLGCTAPYSVASTKDGIIFANNSGIYRLTRNLTVDRVGRRLARLYDTVNKQALDIATGHHYGIGTQYKLSVPLLTEEKNSTVFVYDHTREYEQQGMGSWTQYDSHPATGWANLENDAFFSTHNGQVFRLRNANDNSDFRDDASAVVQDILLPATAFGDSGVRKVIRSIIAHFRSTANTSGTVLSTAYDLTEDFQDADTFSILQERDAGTGLGDSPVYKIRSIAFSLDKRKLLYVQIRIVNDAIDENMELTGIDYKVAGMDAAGIVEAADTD